MKRKKGFTIIEMMVAMAVLSMLVIAMSRIFQQSLVATDTGYNLVKGNLVGRTIMQYVADDLSNCTLWIGGGDREFNRVFMTTDSDTDALQTVKYPPLNGGILERTVKYYKLDGTLKSETTDSLFEPSEGANKTIEIVDFQINPDNNSNPTYFDIFLSVTIKKYVDADEDSIDTKNFATRVYLQNNNRYKYGKYSEL